MIISVFFSTQGLKVQVNIKKKKFEQNGIVPTLLSVDLLSASSHSFFPRVQPGGSVL